MEKRGTDSSKVKRDIEIKIVKGFYNENVPTIKKISEDYGIGVTTASKIMQTLVAEGTLFSMQGKGYYVSPYCKPVLTKTHTERLQMATENAYEYATALGVDFMDLVQQIIEQKK